MQLSKLNMKWDWIGRDQKNHFILWLGVICANIFYLFELCCKS